MTLTFDLMTPAVVLDATGIGMIAPTIRARRTGEMVWWARLPVWPGSDYLGPDWLSVSALVLHSCGLGIFSRGRIRVAQICRTLRCLF